MGWSTAAATAAVASARLLRVLAGLCGLLLASVGLSVVDKASRKSLAAGPHQPHVLILWGGLVGSFNNPPHLHFDRHLSYPTAAVHGIPHPMIHG